MNALAYELARKRATDMDGITHRIRILPPAALRPPCFPRVPNSWMQQP